LPKDRFISIFPAEEIFEEGSAMKSRLIFVLPFVAAFASGALLLSVSAGAQSADDDRPAMDAAGPMDGDGPMDRDGPMGMGHQISPEDRQAFLDARIAAIHAGLQLSPDQEKLWPAAESAVRDAMTAMRAAREKMKASDGEKPDPIARMRRMAEMSTMRAQNLTKIADAAQPLYASLNDDQKWRLHVLLRAVHMHGMHGMGMMRHGGDDEEQPHEPHEE
jgi:zinc resistance-associated protein